MTINSYKRSFFEALSGDYPPEEVHSFFYILIQEWMGLSRLDLALDPGRTLSPGDKDLLDKGLNRLRKHEPVQYIIGHTEFFGLDFSVNPSVLIPRPETEELVQWILSGIPSPRGENIRILDLGTGSGCIAVALAKHLPEAEVWALDISEEALTTARDNAERNDVQIHFLRKDILQILSLPDRYDVIVSNPPYVRELEKQAMPKNVLHHEPKQALYVSDSDPLVFYRAIAALGQAHLKPKGSLYFEINQYLGQETEALLKEKNFHTTLKKDIFGKHRMVKGVL